MRPYVACFFCVFLFCSSLLAGIAYKVEYEGIDNSSCLRTIKSVGQLHTLQKKNPDTIQALRYRAESDLPELLKIIHAHGYYEATASVEIREFPTSALVIIHVNQGPVYTISSFAVHLSEKACIPVDAKELGITIGSAISAKKVVNAELELLHKLAECGYPLAEITQRSFIADGDTKTVSLQIEVDTGPLCYFGPLTIEGNKTVKLPFFSQRQPWKEGEIYSASRVAEMQQSLLQTHLFSSLLITHEESPDSNSTLPMHIEVSESKHKSIYGGVSYQTYYGPGVTFGWSNRNVLGMGRQCSIQGDFTKRSHSGELTYLVPQFLRTDQDGVIQAEAIHLHILPFAERSYHITMRVERKITKHMRLALGSEGERLFVNSSVQNGKYWIVELPIFLGLQYADDILNPTKGCKFEYTATPSLISSPDQRFFLYQNFGLSYYLPVDQEKTLTFAQKLSGGCIISGGESTVPVPKRFFGGSEEDLRGYAYYSVSPLSSNGKPTGGRSALFYTFESRLRLSKSLGLVPFFDMGNVNNERFLSWQGKWRKSAGIGLRYFSFVGPLRLDIGFPINPRKGLDKKYRILISVGQTF